MEEKTLLRTLRLTLKPMTRQELEARIQTMVPELRQPYLEMLAGVQAYPDCWLWYAPWDMIPEGMEMSIGDLCFKGPQKDGAVEIGYGLEPLYEGKGYMTEAAAAMIRWAFSHPEVRTVEAETEPGNRASQRVLEKLGFTPNGIMGEEGPRFVLHKEIGGK